MWFFSKKKNASSYYLPEKLVVEHVKKMSKRKKFQPEYYEEILAPYVDNYENLRYCDYVREDNLLDRKVLLVRHDVDHDHLTAQKMAKWEYDHNIRSTYCLLHTSWYYGEFDGKKYVHSKDLTECARRLVDLGHEVNFHNNLAVLALWEPIDPFEVLARELDFFRSNGIEIIGTSTHGDKLCRELNFRNWEIFKECCGEKFGGPRKLTYAGNEIALGERSMFDFGLEYEGYDVARDVYHTDSGGNMRTRLNTSGRRDFGRLNPESSTVVGILTHPLWWDFGTD